MSDLKKWILTEDDFSKMKWHDCSIYAMAFQKHAYKLMFDIDYIFKWVTPTDKENPYYKFWIAPTTLVFENVYDLEIDISSDLSIEIDTIYREEARQPKNHKYIDKTIEWKWIISTQCGEVSFRSVGYKMYVRKEPSLKVSQKLGFDERDGISFYQGKL